MSSNQNSKSSFISRIIFKINRIIRRLIFLVNVGIRVIRTMGFKLFLQKLHGFIATRLHKGIKVVDLNSEYPTWLQKTKLSEKELKLKRDKIKDFKLKPLISIIFPVYNVEEKWLRLALNSVLNQIYDNWELCIVDDASTQEHIKPILEEYSLKDKRIKVKYLTENQHISGSSNECLKLATGEIITLMDNDDEIEPNALYEFVKVYNSKKGELDFVYSDEDQIEIDGKPTNPILKPDWSPEMTLSMMYTTHLGFYRKSLVDQIGGFRKGVEGSQDYDLVLRFTEKTSNDRIYHIPQILYHWRRIPGSTAEDYDAKPYAKIASSKALTDTIERRKLDATLEDGLTSPSFHIKRKIHGNPKVSIIIPFRDKIHFVKKCVDSIEKNTNTDGFTYEIILVNNDSTEKESLDYLKEISQKHTVLDHPFPFNYSELNNMGVKNSEGDYLLFLNNDTSVITNDWLYEMLQLAQIPEIGCVGAKLLFPNDTVQHAGVYIHKDGIGGHIYRGFYKNSNGYMDRLQIINNVSAVTGACLMISRKHFVEMGGFNQEKLPVAFNDVDLCLKCLNSGLRNVYTPFAELYHYESISRGAEDTPEKMKRFNKEWDYMFSTWREYLKQDHYYNTNLVLNNGVLSLNFDVLKEI